MPEPMRDEDGAPPPVWGVRGWLIPLGVVLAALTVPIGGSGSVAGNPNEMSRILLAVSLAESGSIAVNDAIEVYGSSEDLAAREGKAYSGQAPGLSFLSAPVAWMIAPVLPPEEGRYPAYWPLRRLLIWLFVALPAALLPFLMLRRYPALGADRRPALALILALATPLFTYATVFFSHAPAAVLCAAAYAFALRPGRSRETPSPRAAVIGGILAGFAVTTEYPTAIVGVVIFGALIARRGGWRVVIGFAAGFVVGLLPLLVYSHSAFGSAFTTGYAFMAKDYLAAIHHQGFFGVNAPSATALWGVLGSARRGVLFYCPLFLLVPYGLWRMARSDRRDLWPLVVATTLYIAFAAGFTGWHGGWCAAARNLIPVLPLWYWPIASAVDRMSERPLWRVVLVALVSVSLGNALLSLAVTPFFPSDFQSPLMQVALRCLLDGAAFPNMLSDITSIPAWPVMAIWAAAVVVAVGVALVRLLPPAKGRLWVAPAVIAFIAASLLAQWTSRPAPTTDQEELRALVLERVGYPQLAERVWSTLPR